MGQYSDTKEGCNASDADVLVSDTIANYKTVASFGNDIIVTAEYSNLLEQKTATQVRNGIKFGLTWGLSQAFNNLMFAVLYLVSAALYANWP